MTMLKGFGPAVGPDDERTASGAGPKTTASSTPTLFENVVLIPSGGALVVERFTCTLGTVNEKGCDSESARKAMCVISPPLGRSPENSDDANTCWYRIEGGLAPKGQKGKPLLSLPSTVLNALGTTAVTGGPVRACANAGSTTWQI